MKKLGSFIVKGRYVFLGIFFVLLVASAVLMNFVKVNYDLTEYLPDSSNTKQSVELMKKEFGATGTAAIMLKNVSNDQAEEIASTIQTSIETVSTCVVSRTQEKDGTNYAMLNVFLTDGDYTTEAEATLTKLETYLKETLAQNQTYYMIGSAVTAGSSRSAVTGEIPIILIVAVIIVILVLTLTTRSWIEPLIFLIIIGSAILINMGTNYFLGSISFISNSISSVLLIALAMDYSIVLVNRFREEREKNPNVFEAMKSAINGSFVTIVASGLTVMAGLISLVFMNYKIGMDMGIVLTKGVFISLLAVIFLMPAVLLLFAKIIQKTEHKNFLKGLSKIGTFAKKTMWVFPLVFVALIAGAFVIQSQMLSFDYAAKFNQSGNKVYESEKACKEVFGESNSLVVIMQTKDGETVKLSEKAQLELFDKIKNIEVKVNGEDTKLVNSSSSFLTSGKETQTATGSTFIKLGDEITQAFLLVNYTMIPQISSVIIKHVGDTLGYSTYVEEGSTENAVFAYNTIIYCADNERRAALILEVKQICAYLYSQGYITEEQYNQMIGETVENPGYPFLINQVATFYTKEQQAEDIYFSDDKSFARMIFNINAEMSSQEAKDYITALNKMLASDYDNQRFFLVNNTQNVIETADVFASDRLKVELISALAILLICLFSFRSISLPILLVLVIEGAIWINLAGNALLGNSIFFICYLLGTAIQMGATIDYGILLVDRYKEARKTQDKFTAIKTAIDRSFATILSSGSILTLAAFTISIFSSVPLISSIGTLIGFGALCASLTILFVFPQVLLLLDKFIAKTTLKSKFVYQVSKQTEKTQLLKEDTKALESGKVENLEVVETTATPLKETNKKEQPKTDEENNSTEVLEPKTKKQTPKASSTTKKKQTAKKNYKTVKKGPKTKKKTTKKN